MHMCRKPKPSLTKRFILFLFVALTTAIPFPARAARACSLLFHQEYVKVYRGLADVAIADFNPIAKEYHQGEADLYVSIDQPKSYARHGLIVEMFIPKSFFIRSSHGLRVDLKKISKRNIFPYISRMGITNGDGNVIKWVRVNEFDVAPINRHQFLSEFLTW